MGHHSAEGQQDLLRGTGSIEDSIQQASAPAARPAPANSWLGAVSEFLLRVLLVPWAGVLCALVVVSAIVTLISPYFLTTGNLLGTVALYLSWVCIAAFGEGLVIIGGGLDLSVGSVMGFTGMVCAMILTAGLPGWLAVVAAIGAGCLIGVINGILITRIGLNPFIATLAMLSIVRGLTYGVIQGAQVTLPDTPKAALLSDLGNGTIGGIPVPAIIMLLLGFVLMLLLNNTPFGRRIYAIGGNETAARQLGLKVDRIKVILYVLSGLCSGIGGVLLLGKVGTALPDAANGYELDVIAAVIIGGTSLTGGRGTMPGILIGAVLLGVINNGIILAGLAGYWQQFVTGSVIAGAVSLDILRGKIQARRGLSE